MALLPDIHVNVGQLTFERIYQLFLPFIPGSTLVGGLLFAHPISAHTMAVTLGLGRYSRFAVPAQAVDATLAWSLLAGVSKPKVFLAR